jgi:hypothetical protein
VFKLISSPWTSGDGDSVLFLSMLIPGKSFKAVSICSEGTSGESEGEEVALGDLALVTF